LTAAIVHATMALNAAALRPVELSEPSSLSMANQAISAGLGPARLLGLLAR
jgi:hypothetical protein